MPENQNNLINIDVSKLSEPANTLIHRVSNAIGILHEPRQIREKAKAEADAKIIHANADAGAQDIAFRSSERIGYQKIRRQKNIEAITLGAVDVLEQEVARLEGPDSPGMVQESTESRVEKGAPDDDWIHQFYNYCNDVSDKDMQVLWSKILAGEFQNHGSFSLRALNTVSMLAKEDAELFTKCCSIAWINSGDPFVFSFTSHIFRPEEEEYKKGNEYERWGLPYNALHYLEDLGLINLNAFILAPTDGRVVAYGRRFFKLNIHEHSNLKIHSFTDIGATLLPLSSAPFHPKEFSDWVIDHITDSVDVEEIPEDQVDLAMDINRG